MPAVLKKANEPIPGYKLMQRIGAGGYGEVWTAEAPGGLIKAIKFVYGLLDEDRATRELKAIHRIKGVRHPFLLSIERIEIIDGQLMFVTELADGGSLKDRFDQCRKEGRTGIPRDELLQHLRDTADALDYMSENHSLQHLDVKPENLLLVGGRVKVADFGLVKDLHEGSASMMGGLTPIYAPPEVFEGRPTKFSDQYSLAIVYQEMLSGVLPFPGKTAAQLAAQHLNAKPRMAALPEADQQVIGKSLSKNPAERFASCREMVAALHKATQAIVSRMTNSRADLLSDLSRPITQGATQANTSPQPAPAQPVTEQPLSYATEAPRTPGQMISTLDEASQQADALQQEHQPALGGENFTIDIQERFTAADAPPPAFDTLNWTPQPTLIVGLGGLGVKVVARVKRLFSEQPHGAALQTLLIDTDRREATEALQTSASNSTCRSEDLLHVPLRKSSDYRTDSRRMLEWLGRRWLYNIPRSQLTEGLRPLGRLALVDHSPAIWTAARTALKKLTEPLPTSDVRQVPRVIVVAASGGGTGGGMVLDLVLGLQQQLEELKQKDARLAASEVSVVLAHTTPRNAQGAQLAMANTCALLAEWEHLLHPGAKFPGDPACGLKPQTIDKPPRTRLIDLGEELSAEDFDEACSRIADLVALDVGTPADNYFRASEQAQGEKPFDADSLPLRTTGLVRVGFTHDELATRAVRNLCHELLGRWAGKPKATELPKPAANVRATNLLPMRQTPSNADNKMKDAFLDLQAGKRAAELGLEAESLLNQLLELAAANLNNNADQFFQELTFGIAQEMKGNSPVQRWLAATTELFGPRTAEAVAPGQGAGVPAMIQATEGILKERIAATGAALQQWLLNWLEDPQQRLYAAQRTLSWFQSHCRSLLDQFREVRKRLAQETGSLEQYLVSLPTDWKKAKGAKKPAGPEPEIAFQQFCRLRLQDFAALLAGRVVQAMQSTLSSTGDLLVDLNRELQGLVAQYDDGEAAATSAGNTALLGQLRKLVGEQLTSGTAAQAKILDETITEQILTPAGGLLAALTGGGDVRSNLHALLETESRKIVLRQLESLDIAAVLAEGAAIDPQLAADWRTLVERARPRWQGSSAQRRLLCVLPERSQATRDPQAWRKCLQTTSFQESPALLDAAGADLLLVFDVGPLSVTDLFTQLLAERPDLGEVAGRLHTRADIHWPEIVAR